MPDSLTFIGNFIAGIGTIFLAVVAFFRTDTGKAILKLIRSTIDEKDLARVDKIAGGVAAIYQASEVDALKAKAAAGEITNEQLQAGLSEIKSRALKDVTTLVGSTAPLTVVAAEHREKFLDSRLEASVRSIKAVSKPITNGTGSYLSTPSTPSTPVAIPASVVITPPSDEPKDDQ